MQHELHSRRQVVGHQRILCNYLTDEGNTALAKGELAADTVEKTMLDGLDETRTAALRDALRVCVRNLAQP